MFRTCWTDYHYRLALACLTVLFLALALVNIFRLPALNGPDEADHLRYVQVLRTTHSLPLLPRYVPDGQDSRRGDQAQHPPLYYALLAVCSSALPDLDSDSSIRALKLLSVLMGLGALLCTASLARRLWPDDLEVAATATGALALLPMFWVMTSLLNNTAASLFAGALTLLLLHRALTAPVVRTRDWLGIGLCAALGMVAKITAIWLLPVIAVVIWARYRREGRPLVLLPMVGGVLLPLTLLVGAWLYYNLTSFGVLMPERVTDRRYLPDGVATIVFLPYAANLLAFTSLYNIPLTAAAPFWLMYNSVDLRAASLTLLGYALPPLLALLLHVRRYRRAFLAAPTVRGSLLLACLLGCLGAWFVAIQAVLHDWNTGLYAGRYAVDAAPAAALLWAAGLRVIVPHRLAYRLLAAALLLGLLILSCWVHSYMQTFFHLSH